MVNNYSTMLYDGPLLTAYDVGCGSGQSTELLSTYFTKVHGTDVSRAQIAEATKRVKAQNVVFSVALAENIPEPANSVQLISASQAVHWFDLPKFFKEADRTLVENGAIALYGYSFPEINIPEFKKELKDAVDHVYSVETKGYWGPGRYSVDAEYKDIIIPYKECIRENYYVELNHSLEYFSNYITTWSGFQQMKKDKGNEKATDVITNFQTRVMDVLGKECEPSTIDLPVRIKFFLLMARKQAK
ncbi:putative methyltransferase DDB_G0268948 isoform X2 [Artemia franciscana]|uniref:Methyltransferase type 11 domain-containing protein n=1 Tax=Artemia franciscana TaxID=6661 RepID=A0AA88HKL9_ARTSF|nr:hypothetical protein QYM36_010922 [Artemia franciscana]